MNLVNLTNKDWTNLIDFNLVDSKKNGFACTTDKADSLSISLYRATLIRLKGKLNVYSVKYEDGCFYPIWKKVIGGLTPIQIAKINIINK